ncbi:E3 ubiquitin-protein ligase pub1 [Coemansia biformis]|uniref:E3 ubiquitin-protein ligase pub1 n=1 Tax=Coemansia biformis TaxID=1286918 RepID=A0A9W8CYN2_9FUNG|nr:E3 ubiquitin-protein ligase pub1 [Coemansia biformis]
MDVPAAAAAGNGAPPSGMYVPQQQPMGVMNGGHAQYPGAVPVQLKPEDPTAKSLYVGSLDPRVSEQGLLEVFSSVRPVVSVKIIADKSQTHGGLNYGFVEFANHQDAELALQSLNGHRIIDSEIRVNWAFTSAAQAHEDPNNQAHIFIGDLSAEVNDQVLAKAFSVYPSMCDARVMWDKSSGKSRGYGFVAFRDRADADKAISQMNGELLGSRAIRVNWANQKTTSNRPSHDAASQQPLNYEAVRDQTAQYNTTVYVGNLATYTSQEQLQLVFQPFGFVLELRMLTERGFAFVKMDTHESAAMAITQLSGTLLNSRPMRCSWGKERVADPKNAFGAMAAAAANPTYTYPYVYGVPQQQFGVPGTAASQQQQPPANNPQGWSGFGYDTYGYYGNPSYPQPGQMMPPAALSGHSSSPSTGPVSSSAQAPEGGY